MAFIFTMRSTSIGGHRRAQSISNSLPAIDEDNVSFISNSVPPVPRERGTGRTSMPPLDCRSGGEDAAPPAYNQFDDRDVRGPHGEKLAELRKGVVENRHIAKRGGWRKLFILILGIIVIAIGLGVGLGIGLKKNGGSSSADLTDGGSGSSSSAGGASGNANPPPSNLDSPPNATFPIGSYTFQTYLNTIAANCSSNPATWMCYPYSTYAQSPSTSSATFDWIIRPSASDANNLTISSTPNPFSILFTSIPLRLMKAGTDDEHYFFQLSMSKPTKPSTQLGAENVAATCYFDDTTLQAYLYTKRKKTYPKEGEGAKGAFETWPGAVKVEQVAGGRKGSPRCVDSAGVSLGDFGVEDGTQLCDCLWLNTGT